MAKKIECVRDECLRAQNKRSGPMCAPQQCLECSPYMLPATARARMNVQRRLDHCRTRPDTLAVLAALVVGVRSPCAKSRRGVVAYNAEHRTDITGPSAAEGYQYSSGNNRPPLGKCTGSDECKRTCSARCVHAEAVALLGMPQRLQGAALVHVKLRADVTPEIIRPVSARGLLARDADVDALIEPSGPPSCLPCAVLIAADARVSAIWLYHREGLSEISAGWRGWSSSEFLDATIASSPP